jgi:hypothetical protein
MIAEIGDIHTCLGLKHNFLIAIEKISFHSYFMQYLRTLVVIHTSHFLISLFVVFGGPTISKINEVCSTKFVVTET